MHSKNDLFTTDWSVRSLPPPAPPKRASVVPPVSPVPVVSVPAQSPTSSPAAVTPIAPPAIFAPAITVSQPAGPSSLTTSDAIELRVLPGRELGHGRHATVHLAAYREQNIEVRHTRSPHTRLEDGNLAGASDIGKLQSSSDQHVRQGSSNQLQSWRICAAKRFSVDKEAQVAGLSEALMLSRLAKCPQVLHFIALKDETLPSRPSSLRRASNGVSGSDSSDGEQYREGTALNMTHTTDSNQSLEGDAPSSTRASGRDRPLPSGGSLSTPSSPHIKASSATSVPPLLDLRHLQIHQESSKSNLRRTATVKVPRSPSPYHSQNGRPASATQGNLTIELPVARLFLLTEYCPLGNLATFTRQHGADILGKRAFYKLAIDLLQALVAVHARNIIHGDVKPQNCLLNASFELKLGDFSSSLFDSSDLTDGIGLGSTQYSAPEIVQMAPTRFSFPIDIFSAGLTLLFMISGVEPYEALAGSTGQSEPASPLSPRSSRNASGTATPTSATKRKFRASSGAGKVVELHLHLAKGHAWEWEERRRMDELDYEESRQAQGESTMVDGPRYTDDHTAILELPAISYEVEGEIIRMPAEVVHIPKSLTDSPSRKDDIQGSVYSDGYTPVQTFLAGTTIVPEPLRSLLRAMLHPVASERPTAAQALRELSILQATV